MFRLLEFLFITHLGIYILPFSVSFSCSEFIQGQITTKNHFLLSLLLSMESIYYEIHYILSKRYTPRGKFGGQHIIIGQSFQPREVKRHWKSSWFLAYKEHGNYFKLFFKLLWQVISFEV